MQKGNASEYAVLQDWVCAKLSVKSTRRLHRPQLQVIKQGYGRCMVNQSLAKTAPTIGEKKYARGICAHSVSEILVTLPSAGATFNASIGRDQNIFTIGNMSNIIFVVKAGGAELYRSTALRGGEDPVPVAVPLKGATEFTLSVEGSDTWGHSDWAESFVKLENGGIVWLDELPFSGGVPDDATAPPFSFLYDNHSSRQFMETWERRTREETLDGNRTRWIVVHTDPKTKLEVRCEATIHSDYPAVEWIVYFKNKGGTPTPILENIQALDTNLCRGMWDNEFVLHHAVGSVCAERDFAPLEETLQPGSEFNLGPLGGRSSSGTLPFFNIESSGSGGVIGAIGWSGQWRASFKRDKQVNLSIRAGMEHARLRLLPGEEIRTPRILLIFWRGDRVRSQNLLRSLIFDHYTPQPAGKPLEAPIAYSTWGMLSEEVIINKINALKKARLPFDCFWIDAGWYGECKKVNDWYAQAGNWYPNPGLFPQGLKPVSEAVHRNKFKFLLWFDAERVYKDTQIYREHPEWLLHLDPALQVDPNTGAAFMGCDQNFLLNLGNPAARSWITDHISKIIDEAGIDILREDFNFDPLLFWRKADTPDRQGITEIKYIEGLYAFWDELLKRHPHLAIDNCASGGRRIDLEMIRRSIPLWRSDLQCSPDYSALGSQCQTFGLASWVPLNTCGVLEYGNTYDFRSGLSGGIVVCAPIERLTGAPAWSRKMIAEASAVRKYFRGDFHPLTRYSLDNDVWLAFQLDRPDLASGIVLAFRREKASYPIAVLKLQALDKDARYEVRNVDSRRPRVIDGRQLAEQGLPVELRHSPDSAILHYKKIQ